MTELSGQSGFRLDERWGQRGSAALSSKLSEDERKRLILCDGILTAKEAGRAFNIHHSSAARIWKSARQDAAALLAQKEKDATT